MERTVLANAPDYWDTNSVVHKRSIDLNEHSEEYQQIKLEIIKATRNKFIQIQKITRHQDILDYGQVLVREQHMVVSHPYSNYYRVRRFIRINTGTLPAALKYNVDHRRCGLPSLEFNKYVDGTDGGIILVVQIITNNPNAVSLTPSSSADYFIDYIVHIN